MKSPQIFRNGILSSEDILVRWWSCYHHIPETPGAGVTFVKMKMASDYMWSTLGNEIIFCVKELVDWSYLMQNDISHTSLDACFIDTYVLVLN